MSITKGKSFPQYIDFSPVICQFRLRQLRNLRINCIRSKSCPRHVECSFSNPAEKFLLKVAKFFALSPTVFWNLKCFPKMFLLTRILQFWNYQPAIFCSEFLQEARKGSVANSIAKFDLGQFILVSGYFLNFCWCFGYPLGWLSWLLSCPFNFRLNLNDGCKMGCSYVCETNSPSFFWKDPDKRNLFC